MTTRQPLAFEVFTEVAIIHQLASAMLLSILPRGMTQAQFTILNHFTRRDIKSDSPANLASAMQVTRPTMTSTLIRMERAGLVEITSDPQDGRGKLVSVTPKGKSTFNSCVRSTGPLLSNLQTIVSDAEFSSVLPKLKKIRTKLDRERG